MIMTLNEESNIESAINSFPKDADITVYDSFSSDRTISHATSLGARVVQRRFDDWASHQNWAAKNIQFRSPWVYYSDADERMTPELWREICRAVQDPKDKVAFEIRRKDFFQGTWLKRSTFYPCWFVRLYRPEFVHWERLVNPVAVVDGPRGRLSEHFIHYPFSKGIGNWFQRHVNYAEFEAREMSNSRRPARGGWRGVWSDPTERRRAAKSLFQRLPGRPAIRFLTLYVLRQGFLEGSAGFRYSMMQAMYEYMISLRLAELREKNGDHAD